MPIAPVTARLAGHGFLNRPNPAPKVYVPTRDFLNLLSPNPGVLTIPSRSSAIQHGVDKVRSGKPIEFIGNPKVAMQDWDWPNEGHIAKGAITIRNLGDVHESMTKFTQDNPEELWKMYITPGGVRAFDLARNRTAREGADLLQRELNSDPYYAQFSAGRNVWNSRISPKPGREGDFVALPIGYMGTGTPLSQSRDYVRRFHDIPIMENRIANDQLSIPESAFRLIEQQAMTLPQNQREGIDPVLSMMYARGFLA